MSKFSIKKDKKRAYTVHLIYFIVKLNGDTFPSLEITADQNDVINLGRILSFVLVDGFSFSFIDSIIFWSKIFCSREKGKGVL
jgi:hypothetical protein